MIRTIVALALTALVSTRVTAQTPQDPSPAKASSPTQTIMGSIFAPMSSMLAFSFDRDAFEAPKNRAAIALEIDKLVRNVGQLEQHGKGQDRAFEFVAKSLGRDARNLKRWYAKGRYDEARFILHHMTENCIACHSNLPETRKPPNADTFFAKVAADALPPLERAQLQIMGRRFEDALQTYETYFSRKESDPAMVPQLGAFSDYLRLSISVKSDFKRPQGILEQLVARPLTPLHIRQQLSQWLLTLKAFDAKNILQNADVQTAKRILDEGRGQMAFARDRDGLIHYLTAEAILTRFIRGRSDRAREVGEAYYLLGTATALTEHSLWVPRSDFLLESAIRLAPAAPFAPKAYAVLEENMIAGYSGSSGTHVPNDVRLLLDELKRLIEQEQGKI